MALRRGFKADAERVAAEVRRDMGLTNLECLDPFRLATFLDIPVLALSSLCRTHPKIGYLLHIEPDVFSAVTVFSGTRRVIVHNDGHALTRQASNLAHEIAHSLLFHPPTPPLDDRGSRLWNQDIEDEASWLGGALLIPLQAALSVAYKRWSEEETARHFGVSSQMVRFRINATGAAKRAALKSRSPVRRG